MTSPEPDRANYGFTVIGRMNAGEAGLFLSGLEWEAGRLCRILPRRGPIRPGDYVPAWETEAEAREAIRSCWVPDAEAHVTFWEVIDDADTILAGGPNQTNKLHRGVDGFVIPPKPRSPLLDAAVSG